MHRTRFVLIDKRFFVAVRTAPMNSGPARKKPSPVMKIDLDGRCGPLAPRGNGGVADGHAVQAAGRDWPRRTGTGKGKTGRPGATVKLKIVETAFSA
jgi:hypothetical protein